MASDESKLSALHEVLTDAYTAAVQGMKSSGEYNAAMLTSAANFLKHNNISCDPESEDMKKLKEETVSAMEFPFNPSEAQSH